MSADDATHADTLASDAEPAPGPAVDHSTRDRSTHTRQTAAYWSMTRTMSDFS
ncbi:hypothetical protein [Salinigranum rubrum]|uniref:hypothetical protein n=1 Tax=Salinigranum rubrum TaxID=755307 RepID=UPI0013A5788E|nr:hypothetical protein [Salinigranum rubrum]